MNILNQILVPYSLATIGSVILNLLLAFALGVVVAAVYRWTHTGLAEKSFTDTLIILCMLIAVVMVVIGDSVARAFSLVGALSIIRFRTAMQDPRDIAFVFFALAVGMAVGAGDPTVAIIGTFLIGGIIIGLHRWHLTFSGGGGFILTFRIPLYSEYEQFYRSIFTKHLTFDSLIRHETKKSSEVELEFQIKLKEPERWMPFFQELSALEGIADVKLTKP